MKKILAAAMAVMMLFGMAGCKSSTNKDFKKMTDNVTDAVKSVCGAYKANSDQINEFRAAYFSATSPYFNSGAYYTCDKKDVEASNFGSAVVKPGQMTDVYLFCKTDGTSSFVSQIVAVEDEELAKLYFDETVADLSGGRDEESMKALAEEYGFSYGIDTNTPDEYAIILFSDVRDSASAVYVKRQGKVVATVVYNGKASVPLCSEYYEVMNKTGFKDMQALLNK